MNTEESNGVVQKCKDTLAKVYGKRLKGVILYGSIARNTAGKTSDIDLLILLSPPFDYFAELRRPLPKSTVSGSKVSSFMARWRERRRERPVTLICSFY